MSLNATLRVPLAKNILRGFEAINEEGILCFDESGLSVMLVDGNHYKMLRVVVPAEAFQSYEYSFDKPQEVGVIFARMGAIIKTLVAKDELTLAIDTHKDNPRFRLLANGISQTVKLLRLDLMNRVDAWPQRDWDYQTTIPGKNVKDFLRTVEKTVSFTLSAEGINEDSSIVFQSNSQDEPVIWKHPVDLSGEVGPTLFTTTEVASSLTAVGKNDIDIRGALQSPVEFDWNIEGCQFTALIANRS
jgi:DNA polymerase III sliding clamp (beta) subunit (PCNA family)